MNVKPRGIANGSGLHIYLNGSSTCGHQRAGARNAGDRAYAFLGTEGVRTQFLIEVDAGVDLEHYSIYQGKASERRSPLLGTGEKGRPGMEPVTEPLVCLV